MVFLLLVAALFWRNAVAAKHNRTAFALAEAAARDGDFSRALRIINSRPPGEGDVAAAADQWAVGIIAYRCLSGRLPYTAEADLDVLMQVVRGEYEPLDFAAPGLPDALTSCVERALALEPAHRHSDTRSFAQALLEVARPPSMVPSENRP